MIRQIAAGPLHEEIHQEVFKVIQKYSDKLDGIEILAIMSKAVGALVALQDQNQYTPDQVMAIVAANLEAGNRDVVKRLQETPGGMN